MIPNQWYVIADSKEVKKEKVLGLRRFSHDLAVYRTQSGEIGVVEDLCAHRGVALSKGKVHGENIACPFHGFQYDKTGKGKLIPAIGNCEEVPERFHVKSYEAREKYGYIWVWYGEEQEEYPEIRFFDELYGGDFAYDSFTDPWNAHYSRVIENQLDVVHIPFVHYNTIGRGNKTLINGPLIKEISKDEFLIVPANENQEGECKKPLKAEDLPEEVKNKFQHTHFLFPHVWQNAILPWMRLTLAFVPVDEEHTLLYIRNYLKKSLWPLFWLLWPINRRYAYKVAHQDRPVVETQRPKPSRLHMDENLIPGDKPIAVYRKRRDELQKAAEK